MLLIEVKNILKLKNKQLSFGIDDYELMLELENILLKQGYYWRGENSNYHYLNQRKYKRIVLYINYYSMNSVLEMCMDSSPNNNIFNESDIVVTRQTLNLIENVFDPKPNYLPRKINREI